MLFLPRQKSLNISWHGVAQMTLIDTSYRHLVAIDAVVVGGPRRGEFGG
jgi:hypothetical protein